MRPSKILTVFVGASLAFASYAGVAGAIDTPADEIANDPCAQNHELPQCQGDDDPDPGPGIQPPDLDWCFSVTPEEDCAPTDGGGGDDGGTDPGTTTDGHDVVPTAEPATAVAAAPNFTG